MRVFLISQRFSFNPFKPSGTSPHLISPYLISSHLTSSHLTSPHLISSHLISSHLTLPHLTSSHFISPFYSFSFAFFLSYHYHSPRQILRKVIRRDAYLAIPIFISPSLSLNEFDKILKLVDYLCRIYLPL